MTTSPATEPVTDKGYWGGKCNRTACMRRPATWWSSVERAHYCEPCATEINKFLPPNVAKLVHVPCAHGPEQRMRDTLPCPWCVIDELKRNRDALSVEPVDYMTPIRSLVAAFDSHAIDSKHCIGGIRDLCGAYLRGRAPVEPEALHPDTVRLNWLAPRYRSLRFHDETYSLYEGGAMVGLVSDADPDLRAALDRYAFPETKEPKL